MRDMLTRRDLLKTLTTTAVTAAVSRGLGAASRPTLAFSTLGCPNWSWRQILDTAVKEGYGAVELRGLMGEMDLPKSPVLAGTAAATALKDVKAAGLRIACVSASSQLHSPDAAERAKQMDEARRFIDLAHRLEAPNVRVFGNNWVKEEAREVTLARVSAGLRELVEAAKGSGAEIIIESHGDFTDSATLTTLLDAAPGAGLLWDTHHTVVAAKEDPKETFAKLGKWARHTHIKDSVPGPDPSKPDDRAYVLTGTGQVPVKQIVQTLVQGGYTGCLCFEWEKKWHPEIAEPEIAIPQYAKTVKAWLS
jgi:sugar phosphate isomerase/epimerase